MQPILPFDFRACRLLNPIVLGMYFPRRDELLLYIDGNYRAVGNFDGEDEVIVPISKSISGLDTWEFCFEGVFSASSTTFATIYGDYEQEGVSSNALLHIGRVSTTPTINITYDGALVLGNLGTVWDDKWHSILVRRLANGKLDLWIDGIFVAESSVVSTTTKTTLECKIGSRVATRYPVMQLTKADINGSIFDFLEGSGNAVTARDGLIANIVDNPVVSFWGLEYAQDRSTNGLYSLRESAYTVVPVAESERVVGNFNGTDRMVFDEVPSCLFDEQTTISLDAILTPEGSGGGDWLFVAYSSDFSSLFVLRWNTSQQLQLLFVDPILANVTVTFGVWSGTGNLRIIFDNLNVSCFVDEEQLGTDKTFVDRNLVNAENFALGWGGNPEAITGQLWDFKCGDLFVPINEGSGTRVKDSNGVEVASIVDAPTADFWANGIQRSINLNPTGDADLTNAGVLSGFQTIGAQAANHNGSNRFIAPEDKPFAAGIYPTTVSLTQEEIDQANRKVYR